MIAKSKKITVVIPVYGNLNYTIGCLKSLEKTSTPNVDEIIVIDNHPTRDTAYELLKNFPYVSVYCPKENLGVSVSWDAGIKMAKNDYVAVINNDIEMLTPNWDDILFAEFDKDERATIICPWPCSSANEELNSENANLDGLNGSFFVVDRHSLQLTDNYKLLAQYIDHRYYKAYWEDCDLLMQVRMMGGHSWVTPKIKTVHYGNKTAGPMLPSHKGLDNPHWANLQRFNEKYNVHIWDCFQVFMSNILDENTGKRLV